MFEGAPKLNAAQALDHEGEYDEAHMGAMFKPTGNKVDVGKRRIRGDDEMAELYQGKSVSRAQLNADSQESEEEESYGEEGEEDMSESNEDEVEESFASDDDIDAALGALEQEDHKVNQDDGKKAQAVQT